MNYLEIYNERYTVRRAHETSIIEKISSIVGYSTYIKGEMSLSLPSCLSNSLIVSWCVDH